jgi:putative addiction module component (TIGR02574 family)
MSSIAPKADPSVVQLFEQALRLPKEQRLQLAEQLCESAEADGWPNDMHPAWRDEITRRVAGLIDGTAVIVDSEEQKRRLQAKFGA